MNSYDRTICFIIIFYILASNEIFNAFLNLSNSFDDLDKELNNVYALFQSLEIPSVWLQSTLFDWKQVFIVLKINRQYYFLLDKY